MIFQRIPYCSRNHIGFWSLRLT